MLKRPLIALVAVCLSTATLAQTGQPTETKKESQEAPAAAQSSQPPQQTTGVAAGPAAGLKIATSANLEVRFLEVKPVDFMATKLIGINVYNNQEESLGEIKDIVFQDGKSLTGVVVSVGGFLGFGEHYVVLDPATVVLNEKDGSWRAHVNTTKDKLENAPKFTYNGKT